jgi:valyl-tRNA synthetase
MSELAKAYEPQPVESKWYQYWLDQNFFTADPARVSENRPAYSIVIPPPNVTGVLTMGHVLNNTIQDILARKARMDGKEVLWLPGTDHAGIATQNVVEKTMKKAGEIKHRNDLGREALVAKIWDWKEKYGGIILQQLRALGASCDWTRTRFTMDAEYSRCVAKVFVDLYKKGLIYRGKRMVNWCPASLTALSDEEVIMKEQRGFMYHFKVEVVESIPPGSSGRESAQTSDQSRLTSAATGDDKKADGPVTDAEGRTWLTIATTRPETIPADTAVAVNPKDPRYTHLIGKHVYRALPLDVPKEQRKIPIIADEHVDFEFGTGVLKVTPAHDKADFEIGQRHKLPVIDVLTPDAKMTAEAGAELAGLDRFAARKKAAEIMEAAGSLEKAEPYTNNVGYSERADVPIEPRLSEQWFLKYPSVEQSKACVAQAGEVGRESTRAQSAGNAGASAASISGEDARAARLAALESGLDGVSPHQMRFVPDRWAKVYDHWMGGIQDWCISRQLWWGHRIPVWRKLQTGLERMLSVPLDSEGPITQGSSTPSTVPHVEMDDWCNPICQQWHRIGDDEFIHEIATTSDEKIQWLEAHGYTQDPDVLDTWFSSWLWPFATMEWIGNSEIDSKNPTLKAFYPTTDLVTGPDIIFFWVARMIMAGYEYMGDLPFRNVYYTGIIRDKQGRKMSKSLGNSPDPLDLITRYGADALRFGVMRAAPLGQDILFDEQNVELGRNFCNKLWNACRFRQMQGGEAQGEIDVNKLRADDKWILLKLHAAIKELDTAFAEYRFSDATQTLYRFFYNEYCDWYVESCKAVLQSGGSGRESAQTPPEEDQSRLTSAATDPKKANVVAVMDFVLSHTLRLFHPFLPFITEELWHGMGYAEDMPEGQGGRSIMHAPWPKPFDADFRDHYSLDDCYLEFVDNKFDLVSKGRNLRAEARIAANKKVKFILKPAQDLPPNDIEVIKLLLNAETLEVNPDYSPGRNVSSVKAAMGELYLPLEGLVDTTAELARLTKELEKIVSEVTKVEQKLANPNFTQKVPPEVLTEHRKRLDDWIAKKDHIQKALDGLKS